MKKKTTTSRSRYLTILLIVGLITALLRRRQRRLQNKDSSPSKKKKNQKLPLIGDLHHTSPHNKPLLHWSAWSSSHGAVATGRLLWGVFLPIVVLNTVDSAAYFFARKGAHCHDRPKSVSMQLLTGVEETGRSRFTLVHDYDDDLRLRHRVLTPSLGPLAAHRYQAVMDLEVRHLLVDILGNLEKKKMMRGDSSFVMARDEIHPLLERTMASMVTALHYGIRIPDVNDTTYTRLLAQHQQVAGLAANPWLIDLFPALRHLPLSLSPWRKSAKAMFDEQSQFNLSLLRRARSSPSWNAARQADAVMKSEADDDDDDNDSKHENKGNQRQPSQRGPAVSEIDLAYVLATSVEGAMETVSRQALWLLLAAATHPAQLAEIHDLLDRVVGRDRLPRFSDRAAGLAYIDAFVAETMRWRPVTAISIPRRTGRADEYKGARVAKGVPIVANSWAIGRDRVFESGRTTEAGAQGSNVEEFVPERWLLHPTKDINEDHSSPPQAQGARLRTDLSVPVFGQGRRGCLGQRVALDALFLQAAVLLWAFDIEVADNKTLDPTEMEASGFMALPAPYKLVLKPRGDWVVDTIKAEWDGQEKDVDVLLGAFSI